MFRLSTIKSRVQASRWSTIANFDSRVEMGGHFHGFHYRFTRTSRQHDSIMVVVDRLTKVAHFILVKSTYSTSDVAQVFIRDIVRLNGVLKNILSDRDANFTSKFWKELFAGLGTELAFNATYHS